jgi:3-deoxy-7-phosphoheptulonate synthase
MCLAAIAAGADGLLIECHPDPEHAVSDGAQSITPQLLGELMAKIKRIAQAVDRSL